MRETEGGSTRESDEARGEPRERDEAKGKGCRESDGRGNVMRRKTDLSADVCLTVFEVDC